jgi:DNA-binding response OmpR family regulator
MKILVVEDQEETAAILKRKLEAECYAVDVEYDGERGFYKARTNDYDLILLDKGLPGKNGDEICSGLREYNIGTPVMILSVAAEIEDKVSLLNCGADDYLSKPYAFSELAARMKALLRRPAQYEGNMLSIDGLSLDRETYFFTFRGKTGYLTPKEFMILEYLMKNAGRVVSRGTLLEHAWDSDVDQFSKSIDMHIMNLRRKIDPHDKDSFIRAVPGRGYIVGAQNSPKEYTPPPNR